MEFILLKRKKGFINLDENILDSIRMLPHEIQINRDRILKLDRRHVVKMARHPDNYYLITRNSFPHHIMKEMQQAELVIFKEDWNEDSSPHKVLKFRYDEKELQQYLDIIKEIPIFEKTKEIYDPTGVLVSRTEYKDGYWTEILY